MLDDFTLSMTLFAIAGSGLVAGLYFVFSNTVMRSLEQMPAPAGITAMQRINVTIVNPLFMLVFMGTPLASAYLFVCGLINLDQPGTVYLLAGSGLHIVGSLLITIAFNVPRNNALAAVDPDSDEGARYWAVYLRDWTRWNHVRTVASTGSIVLLGLALFWS